MTEATVQKSQKNQGFSETAHVDSCKSKPNKARTGSEIDAPVTQPRSGFDPGTMRANLMAQRNAAGAESAIGHHCSNLIELLQLPELPRDLIRRQLDGLDRLRAGLQ